MHERPDEPEIGWNFDNSYARLPEAFYSRLGPVPVRAPSIAVFNHALAVSLGLKSDVVPSSGDTAIFSGNRLAEGSEPIAQAYAGHQFGRFTILGDGRAILLGEHLTPNNERFDIQLKGSGPTPYSRRGDGRAALGPMLREYIISEAMAALGIPTTRSLAVVTTGEPVFRDGVSPGAILTRVAASHIRVGTFEYAARLDARESIQCLADYTLRRHFPELLKNENPYLALLQTVVDRQASLVAQWLSVGFIHGVMNTDNMAISGETIDYGPCAFMNAYDPATVFSSIDQQGRYAFANQSQLAQWNLVRLAETLLPLLHANPEHAVAMAKFEVEAFQATFQRHWLSRMREKLGLMTEEPGDLSLIESLLKLMHQHGADYTNTFRALSSELRPTDAWLREAAFVEWNTLWQRRLERQSNPNKAAQKLMRSRNPAVIARNHRVEEALAAAVERADYTVMHSLLAALKNPYRDPDPQATHYTLPPVAGDNGYQTFCGT